MTRIGISVYMTYFRDKQAEEIRNLFTGRSSLWKLELFVCLISGKLEYDTILL